MNKKFFLLASVALMLFGANAQSKLSPATKLLLGEQKVSGISPLHKAPTAKVDQRVLTTILLEKGATVTDEQLAALDIQVEKRRGSLIFANVPVSKLDALAEVEGIRSVDTGVKRKPLNDKAREASSVSMVHNMNVVNGTADVPEQYRGQGVLVAIIDTDIDLGHPIFRDANGKSRIKHIEEYIPVINDDNVIVRVDHKLYDEDEIDQAILDTEDVVLMGSGHGTHVSGIAAGSTAVLPESDPMKNYYGMAPEADLLIYDIIGDDSQILSSLADAFDRAEEMQRPLVVNCSMGNNSARLDGTDAFNVNLQALIENYDMTGKLFCISAGNEGDDMFTVQMECNHPIINNDWTFQHALPCVPVTEDDAEELEDGKLVYELNNDFSFYASDNSEFGVQYLFVDPSGSELFVVSPFFTTPGCMDGSVFEDSGLTESGELYYVKIKTVAECTSTNRTYLTSTVEATFSAPVRLQANIGTRSEGVQIDGAVLDTSFDEQACTTPVNSWGSINPMVCNDLVLGIGSYTTRTEMNLIFGQTFWAPGEVGDISVFSSYCHPHYGDMNPVLAAPGMMLLSAMHHNIDMEQAMTAAITTYGGVDYLWAYNAGTSMSSPAAAGIIALWLQANPNLTREDIIEILANTCDYDEYCEASPYRFGYGKINAKRGIDYILNNTVGLTSVANGTDLQATKYIDAEGRIMIRKGDRQYDVMGVER